MHTIQRLVALLIAIGLFHSQSSFAQAVAPRYKLTIIDDAAVTKRAQRGRMSSQATVKVTDENDVPVAGIAVLFTIPQFVGGGAGFASGALTSSVVTNSVGVATSGSFVATTGTNFTMSASAGSTTITVPINTAALVAAAGAGTGAGVSTGLIVGILGAAAAGGILAAKVLGGGSSASPAGTATQPPAPSVTTGSIGAPRVPVFVP